MLAVADDYNKACTQVVEILKALPKSQYDKIPSKEIEYYKKNADPEYHFIFRPNVSLEEQKILRTTYAILITIYRDFFITESRRTVLEEILNLNRIIRQKNRDN